MKKAILVLWCALCMFSCNNEVKKNVSVNSQDTPYFDPNYKYIQQIPDSLRTPEQKKFLKDLSLVVIENLKVVNNEMVFTLTKDQFVAKGFPVKYYELVQKDLLNNNKYFRKNNIHNVDSILKESYNKIIDSLSLK